MGFIEFYVYINCQCISVGETYKTDIISMTLFLCLCLLIVPDSLITPYLDVFYSSSTFDKSTVLCFINLDLSFRQSEVLKKCQEKLY